MAMPVQVRSERLLLRLVDASDLDAVHALFSSSGHTVGDGPVNDPAITSEWLERRGRLHRENGLAWYGLWEHGDHLVGTCGAFIGRCGEEPEIGYEIAESRRGSGLAAEAVSVVTSAAHEAGHDSLWATIRPTNVASVRTAVASGYRMIRNQPDDKGPLDYYVHTR